MSDYRMAVDIRASMLRRALDAAKRYYLVTAGADPEDVYWSQYTNPQDDEDLLCFLVEEAHGILRTRGTFWRRRSLGTLENAPSRRRR